MREQVPQGPLLEVGCGTGLLSAQLLRLFPEKKCLLTDGAPGMLEQCQSHLGSSPHVNYQLLMAEHVSPSPQYSLLAHSYVAQWFVDLPKTLAWLNLALKEGGVVAMALPTEESFREWREVCEACEVPWPGNPLPSMEALLPCLSGKLLVQDETHHLYTYSRAWDFFSQMRGWGATESLKGTQGKASEMLKVVRAWERFPKVEVSFMTAYCIFIPQTRIATTTPCQGNTLGCAMQTGI